MPSTINTKEIKALLKMYFPSFEDDLIDELLSYGELKEAEPQEKMIAQSELSTDVFFLLTGRMRVILEGQFEGKQRLNSISSGEFFGEMALFNNAPRSTSVVATRKSIVLKFSGEDFQKLIDSRIALLKYIGSTLITRLSSTNEGPKERASFKNIGILPFQSNYDINGFTKLLLPEIDKYGKSLFISKDLLIDKGIWKKGDIESKNSNRFYNYLYSNDTEVDFVLIEGDATDRSWSNLVSDHADKLILIGKKETPVKDDSLKTWLKKYESEATGIDQILILDSRDESEIFDTEKYTDSNPIDLVLHLHTNNDFGRIGRYISGNSIKLILSGGGAKGIAHLGVFKAMKELDIPIDFVGGTSMGSIMAAVIATGVSYEEMVKMSFYSFVTSKPLKDYQLPLVALISGKKMEKVLNKSFPNTLIENLKIPFFAVAANLSKARTEIISNGKVANAVRASISLPGVFPPAVHNGSLMLDGGVVDNFPVDHMNTLADGPNIGVDLSHTKDRVLGYDEVPSNWSIIKDKFNKKKKFKIPSIYQTIMGTMTLASEEKRKAGLSKFDVIINPEVSKFGFLNFEKHDKILEEGYRSSFEVLKKWKEDKKF